VTAYLLVAAVWGANSQRLFELKDTAAYNLTVDQNVHAICADSERARAQIVYVLAAINCKV